MLYNIPAFSKVQIPPAVVAALTESPAVVGVKDSGRSLEYFLDAQDALRAAGLPAGDFGIVTGTDPMLTAYLAGAAIGTICASANVVPAMTVVITQAVARGDLGAAQAVEARLRDVLRVVRVEPPAGVKAAAAALGLCSATMVAPRIALTANRRDRLRDALAASPGCVPGRRRRQG